jgi:hypothetical protein
MLKRSLLKPQINLMNTPDDGAMLVPPEESFLMSLSDFVLVSSYGQIGGMRRRR